MNLDNIDEKIENLSKILFLAEKADKRLLIIKHESELLYRDLVIHKAQMNKEHEDVLRLEKSTTQFLFRSILGDKREQLEKERQEYLQSVLEYNSIANEINLLKYEVELLKKKQVDTVDLKRQLSYYLKVKEQKLIFQSDDDAPKIKKLNQEIDKILTFKREINEANVLAISLEKCIKRALVKLKKVENFNYVTYSGKGKYSSFAKKQYIDGAIKDGIEINYLLNKLDKELGDIYEQYTFFSIYKYQNFIESFYDNLITDWVLKNKLKSAVNCLELAQNLIKRILATLNQDLIKSDDTIYKITEEKRRLVLNS